MYYGEKAYREKMRSERIKTLVMWSAVVVAIVVVIFLFNELTKPPPPVPAGIVILG